MIPRLRTIRIALLCAATLVVGIPVGLSIAVPPASATIGPGCTVEDLITVINTANAGGGATIDLPEGCTYTLSSADNSSNGNNGLPVITSTIDIEGNGDTITRGNTALDFRIFDVAAGGGDLTLSDLTVSNGTTDDEGGGVLNNGTVSLTDVTLSDNAATTGGGGGAGGGGLDNEGNATVTSSLIANNTATSTGFGAFGGGISNNDGSLTIVTDTFSENTAENTASGDALGGAVVNNDGTVTVSGSTFESNSATSSYGTYGGGIDNGSYGNTTGTVTVTASTLSGNTASGTYLGPGSGGGANGGGLNNFGTANIDDSTIAGNTATTNSTYSFGGVGGGVNNFGTMTLTHATLDGNSANSGASSAASISNNGNTATLVATIVANGTDSGECLGTITDDGYNIDDDGSCHFTATESISDSAFVDGTLGSHANNGGPTNTVPLLGGSPAANQVTLASDCNGDDQRGIAWPNPCDMGAAEAGLLQLGQVANGTRCQAGSPGPYDAVQAASAPGDASYAVPAGGGLITSWSTQAGSDGGTLELEIWRPTATPGEYQLVGISPQETLIANELNTFVLANPISVQAGDLLGMRQESQFLECGSIVADAQWDTNHTPGSQPPLVGASEELTLQADLELNLSATFSPVLTKATPIITWSPAADLFGTPLGPAQLDAVAKVGSTTIQGTYTYTPAAGTLLQPGSRPLSVVFTPNDTTEYTGATGHATVNVVFSAPCITSTSAALLNVATGQSYCVTTGARVSNVTVAAGGALYVNGGTIVGLLTAGTGAIVEISGASIVGPLSFTKATSVSLCGDTINGSVIITRTTGAVLFGGVGCVGNTVSGVVSITHNTGGVSFSGNKLTGIGTVTGNSGSIVDTGNTVVGLLTVSGNN